MTPIKPPSALPIITARLLDFFVEKSVLTVVLVGSSAELEIVFG
jgi:hypothetical protein